MHLARLAAQQGGVFARRQARDAGYSPRWIKRRIDRGEWVTVQPQVYAATSSVIGEYGRLWAGYLAAGRDAVVSHVSAAYLHGLHPSPPTVWVTVPPQRHLRLAGVTAVRVPLQDTDIDVLGRMRVTRRERTLVDCLSVLPFAAAADLLDRALQKQWISTQRLAARTRERLGRHGTPQLLRLLRHATSDARFEAERRLHQLLWREGIRGWRGNAEVRDISGTLLAVADVLFPRVALVVEVDGRAYHSASDRFQRDRQRQNALVGAGYTVLRFTWYDIVERPDYVVVSIRAMLERLSL